MTAIFTIDLTPHEQTLLDEIRFQGCDDPVDVRRSAEAALRLTQSLLERGGIPEHRRSYFTDAQHNAGGPRVSGLQRFERNGCRGVEVLRHPHFLKHLRYFIFGADLPGAVCNAFKAEVDACGFVTSGDVEPLCKKARALVRGHRLVAHRTRDEFYKLALDCGLSQGVAASIRNAVRTVQVSQ